jgi:DNA mismatch repair ATPase MutS
MANRINQIRQRLTEITTEMNTQSNNAQQSHQQIDRLRQEEDELNQELRKIEAKQRESKTADVFLVNHRDMEYIGVSDGKTETVHGKPFGMCKKCNKHFEMFIGDNGVNKYITGVCPGCNFEVDFTNVEEER